MGIVTDKEIICILYLIKNKKDVCVSYLHFAGRGEVFLFKTSNIGTFVYVCEGVLLTGRRKIWIRGSAGK